MCLLAVARMPEPHSAGAALFTGRTFSISSRFSHSVQKAIRDEVRKHGGMNYTHGDISVRLLEHWIVSVNYKYR